MSVLPVGFGSSGGYEIDNSLRFRSSASAYLSRTPASAGNRRTWTLSQWMKRGALTTPMVPFGAGSVGNEFALDWRGFDALDFYDQTSSTDNTAMTTSAVYRDPSAWYHILFVWDTTQATSTDRWKLYINGVQITSFSATQYPTQNYQGYVNNTVAHYIGIRAGSTTPFDGYMAEINFIDGQALDPSYFGEFNTDGVWVPKAYTGTYGTNGFYLPFNDATSTTTLGYDQSGNSNNWTCNNISLTAGSTYDHMVDTPTNNYCVVSPIAHDGTTATPLTISEGNLKTTHSVAGQWQAHHGTLPVSSGKWYYEVQIVTRPTYETENYNIGFYDISKYNDWYYQLDGNLTYGPHSNVGKIYVGTTSTTYGSRATSDGDIYMFALDVDNEKFWVGLNGTWMVSGNPSAGINPSASGFGLKTWVSHQSDYAYNPPYGVFIHNYGQRPFAYTAPSGFKALCTANLPEVAIPNPAEHFNTVLYTATGSGQTVDVGFQTDLLWIKNRDNVEQHHLMDAVRGENKFLFSSLTNAESSIPYADPGGTCTVSFETNGFSLSDTNTSMGELYFNNRTYVAWNWKANGSGVTNTDGSITSTVSANQTAGFSIVTYTGTGSAGTVGHGLSSAPKMVIVKHRNTSTHWRVWHTGLSSGYYYLELNLTNAEATGEPIFNGAPTSSVVNFLGDFTQSGQNYIAYCFSEIAGYSKFGSYTGNGSTDGPFVYCGFRPKYVMVKRTDGITQWWVWDASRSAFNVANTALTANTSSTENANNSDLALDLLSNGFKWRTAYVDENASGGTYIFAAFAEHPFGGSNASPSPAR